MGNQLIISLLYSCDQQNGKCFCKNGRQSTNCSVLAWIPLKGKSKGSNNGVIIGLSIVGAVVFVVILASIGFFIWRPRRFRKGNI